MLQVEEVDPQRDLSVAEAAFRARGQCGPNEVAAGAAESRWGAFVRQYRDPMQIGLFTAGVASLDPLKQSGQAA